MKKVDPMENFQGNTTEEKVSGSSVIMRTITESHDSRDARR